MYNTSCCLFICTIQAVSLLQAEVHFLINIHLDLLQMQGFCTPSTWACPQSTALQVTALNLRLPAYSYTHVQIHFSRHESGLYFRMFYMPFSLLFKIFQKTCPSSIIPLTLFTKKYMSWIWPYIPTFNVQSVLFTVLLPCKVIWHWIILFSFL